MVRETDIVAAATNDDPDQLAGALRGHRENPFLLKNVYILPVRFTLRAVKSKYRLLILEGEGGKRRVKWQRRYYLKI